MYKRQKIFSFSLFGVGLFVFLFVFLSGGKIFTKKGNEISLETPTPEQQLKLDGQVSGANSDEESATPSLVPTSKPKPTNSPTPLPTSTPTPSPSPTPGPTNTPTPSATQSPTPTLTPAPTESPFPTPTISPTGY